MIADAVIDVCLACSTSLCTCARDEGDCRSRICGATEQAVAVLSPPGLRPRSRGCVRTESALRRLAAMAYGHSRLNPAESHRSMQLSRDETGAARVIGPTCR